MENKSTPGASQDTLQNILTEEEVLKLTGFKKPVGRLPEQETDAVSKNQSELQTVFGK